MVTGDSRVGQMFGHYSLTGLLGRGGMGEVYRAEDTKKGRTVALKILSEQFWQNETFRTRFQRESRAAAVLQEPHVIPIHDWGEIDGHPYIDMRLVEGSTLQQLLTSGPLDPARAVFIVGGAAAALDAAHAAGLIHRDVKPQNIIVTASDFPYLVDFGIAVTKGDAGLTMTGTHIGTFDYMAPERFRDQQATSAVDVYSLACVLYQCLTGDAPFPTNSLERIMAAHLTSAPPRPSAVNRAVPTAFDDVIARGMAKEPDDRYGSCGALGRAAERALGPTNVIGAASANTMQAGIFHADQYSGQTAERPTDVVPPPPPIRSDEPSRSRQWVLPTVIAVAAALLLGTVGIVIGLLANRNSAPPTATAPDTPDRTVPRTVTETASPGESRSPIEVPLGVGTRPPPPLSGRDTSANPQDCSGDYFLTGQTSVGTRARRGSPATSCVFTQSVLDAYWTTYGNANRDLRQVSARGAVDCRSILGDRRGCDGANFVMECVGHPGHAFITCTGGREAVVYLY